MKAKSALVQGALAVGGLLAAYVTWQRPKETSKADTVVIVEASKNSLEKVHYDDGTRLVSLQRKDRYLVTLAFLEGKRPVVDAGIGTMQLDGGADGGVMTVAVNVPQPAPDRTVYANDRAETVWAKLTPFEGQRALGKLSEQKLDELGLTNTDRHLRLTVSGVERAFLISRPVSGLIGMYAKDEGTQDVFLISSALFNELDPNSQVLIDRRLHLFKQGEFDGFVLKSEGKQAAFVQTGGDIPQTAKVARAASPDKQDELAKNWHDKVWNRLIVTEVLSENELPKAGKPEVRLRIEYTLKGAAKGWLELATDSAQAMWARSENTPSWVAIHQGSEELIFEAQKQLLGAP